MSKFKSFLKCNQLLIGILIGACFVGACIGIVSATRQAIPKFTSSGGSFFNNAADWWQGLSDHDQNLWFAGLLTLLVLGSLRKLRHEFRKHHIVSERAFDQLRTPSRPLQYMKTARRSGQNLAEKFKNYPSDPFRDMVSTGRPYQEAGGVRFPDESTTIAHTTDG